MSDRWLKSPPYVSVWERFVFVTWPLLAWVLVGLFMHLITLIGVGIYFAVTLPEEQLGSVSALGNVPLVSTIQVTCPAFWPFFFIGAFYAFRRLQLNRVEIAEFKGEKGGVGKYLKSGKREYRLENWVLHEVMEEARRSNWDKKPA